MTNLKLAKLPVRTPVKLTIIVSPELNKRLSEYAGHYNQTYSNGAESESVSELVPYMLQSFLDSDRAFVRAQKKCKRENEASPSGGLARTQHSVRSVKTSTS